MNKDNLIKHVYNHFTVPNTTYTFNIKPFYTRFDNYDQSLFLSIGPQLTMAFSTLSVALITTYRNYNNGREIIDSLPILILPLAMILSALLWIPLQKYYSKRRIIDKNNKEYEAYHNYLLKKINECDRYIDTYNSLINKYLSYDSLIDTINNNYIYTSDNLYLPIGYSKDVFRFIFNENLNEEINNNIYYPLNTYLNNLKDNIYVLNLKEYKNVLFLDIDNTKDVITYLSLKNPTYTFLINTNKNWYEANKWIRDINNVYLDNKRLIYLDEEIDVNISNLDQLIIFNIYPKSFIRSDNITINYSKELFNSDIYIANNHIKDNKNNISMSYTYNELNLDIRKLSKQLPKTHISNKSSSLFNLYDEDIDYEFIKNNWLKNNINDGLFINISTKDKVILNLDEMGDGPHGLIAGSTGSGKTELLLSILLSLSISYSPKDLKFIIFDFKGGAINEALRSLPHIAASLSNLDTHLIHRYITQLSFECKRRETSLNNLSKKINKPIMNIKEYRKNIIGGYEYYPDLILLVDEFAELKNSHYDLFKELISISRIGRSLGIHLILSTQKVGGVINEEIWSNTNFKICLKVNDKLDSKEVIGSYDAFKLINPGEFYLLSNHKLKKGVSGYVHSLINDKELEIIDHKLNVINSISGNEEITEIEYVLDLISKFHFKKEIYWTKPLVNIYEGNEIGLIDDYYHNKYIELKYEDINNKSLILYKEDNDKDNFLNRLIRNNKKNIIIDFNNNSIYKRNNVYHIQNEEDILKIVDTLLNNLDNSNISIFIMNLNSLLVNNINLKDKLYNLINNNLDIFTFINNYQNLPYKFYSLFNTKIALCNGNKEEINNFFNKKVDLKINKGHGLIKKDNILDFIYESEMYEQS